jgi:predicted ATPase/class 3 adenylate cyclase
LLTDIEGSTRLWEEHPDAMRAALARHDLLLTEGIEQRGGVVVKSRGEGDSLFAVFTGAADAIAAACALQHALLTEPWPAQTPLRVRIAVHADVAEQRDGDYYGPAVNRCARLRKVAHGGQVLVSQATAQRVRDELPAEIVLRDLGAHRLKDLQQPEHIFQLLHPRLPAEFPPIRSLDALPNNLPRQLTSFIGRLQEMADVKRLLSTTCLLTLTGAGGSGKTRLALQVAADLVEEYADGVWLVELALVTDGALLPQRVASALGVREEPGRPLMATLLDYLHSRELLLILDNCEHLVEACAQLAEGLLRACPDLRVLASSREALGIAGEVAWRVPPLSLPPPRSRVSGRRLPRAGADLVSDLAEYEAVRLFIERATAVMPSLTLTERTAPSVAQVCQRLDGIPLAIELAAARVKLLSVGQIAALLDDCFRLLTGGSRTALPRQQTLRAAIDWSYELLSDAERVLLRRLSVFAGGFTLGAAEAVCVDEDGRPPNADRQHGGEVGRRPPAVGGPDVLELLGQLVDKSLVVVEEPSAHKPAAETAESLRGIERAAPSSPAGVEVAMRLSSAVTAGNGAAARGIPAPTASWLVEGAALATPAEEANGAEARYRLLETIRQYGAERLRGAGEASVIRRRHRDWCLKLAEQAEARLPGPEQALWLARLEIEHHNLRAALDWSEESDEAASGLRLARALWQFWWVRGHLSEGRERLAKLMALAGAEARTPVRAKALHGAGILAYDQGDYAAARALHEESLVIKRELGDKRGMAASLNYLGHVARLQGDYAAARALYQETLAIGRELDDRRGMAFSLNGLGLVARYQGDYAAARAFYEESLAIVRRLDDKRGISISLNNLGLVAQDQGDYAAARNLYEASLAIKRELGDKRGAAFSLSGLGLLALSQEEDTVAQALFEESLAMRRELGDKRGIAFSLHGLGSVALRRGDGEAARALHEESLAIRRELGDKSGVASSLLTLGEVEARQGDWARAARLCGESLTLFRELGDKGNLAACLEALAAVAAGQGAAERAAQLLGAAAGRRESLRVALTPTERAHSERCAAGVRATLGEEAFTARWAEGQRMTLEQALAFAVESTAPPQR